MKVQAQFTITRTNRNGLMEWLTPLGWRSENSIFEQGIEKLYFSKEEGSEKVKELKKDCRLPKLAKSIILNYS